MSIGKYRRQRSLVLPIRWMSTSIAVFVVALAVVVSEFTIVAHAAEIVRESAAVPRVEGITVDYALHPVDRFVEFVPVIAPLIETALEIE